MTEYWKDIEGYEGLYQVSTLGNVKSIKFNRENGMFGYTFASSNYDFATPVFNRDAVEKAVKYLNSHKELWENLI